jgi:vacuolar-type H+-ATPase subunit I/STV1
LRFGIALLVLAIGAILSSRQFSRVLQIARQISDSNAVLNRLDDILEQFRNSVRASRGIEPDAVRTHNQLVESLRSAIRDVRQRTIGNPDQQQRIKRLEDGLEQVIALERRRLEVASIKGVDAGDASWNESHRIELGDWIGRALSEIKSVEASLLSRDKEELQHRRETTEVEVFSSVLLGFVILLAVYYHLEREIGRRQRSESRLVHLNRFMPS